MNFQAPLPTEDPWNQRLQRAWKPFLALKNQQNFSGAISNFGQKFDEKLQPIPINHKACKVILQPDEMEEIGSRVTAVAKVLANSEQTRTTLGATIAWSDLSCVLIQIRNHMFMVFGNGAGGVACTKRAFHLATLATSHFHLVRNMCAAIPRNQELACFHKLNEPAEEILAYLCSWSMTSATEACPSVKEKAIICISMGTQMLANIMTANTNVQNILWPHYFNETDLLRQLLKLGEVQTAKYVLLLIYNCVHKDLNRTLFLANTAIGRDIMRTILREAKHMAEEDSLFDIVYAIVSNIIELKLSATVLKSICYSPLSRNSISVFWNVEHITFLQMIDGLIDAAYNKDGTIIELDPDTCLYISVMFTQLVSALDQAFGVDPSTIGVAVPGLNQELNVQCEVSENGEKMMKNDTYLEALVLLLQILARVTMRPNTVELRETMAKYGLVQAVIRGLEMLTICLPREALSSTENAVTNAFAGVFGLKSDLLRVLGNLCFESTAVQDEIRTRGGIALVLNHTRHDSANPFIREYAIFAIRNLCDKNPENQAIISALEARGVEQDPELGVHAYLDENGKLKMGAKPGMNS